MRPGTPTPMHTHHQAMVLPTSSDTTIERTQGKYEGKYEGMIQNGVPEGWGVLSAGITPNPDVPPNAKRYEGDWREGAFHGKGIKYYEGDGDLVNKKEYEGQWSKGMRNGVGIAYFPNGNPHFKCHWKDDQVDDSKEVIEYFDNGNVRYEGQMLFGLRCGYGTEYVTGDYRNHHSALSGRNVAPRKVYVGCWARGKKEGSGTLFYEDGCTPWYEGRWMDGERHGHGIDEGMRNGPGTTYYPNGKPHLKCHWKDDQIDESEEVIEHFYNGKVKYQGGFLDGLKHGQGIEYRGRGSDGVCRMAGTTGTSFRLIHQSGRCATNEGPVTGRRLSREALVLISGYGVWPLFNKSIATEAGAQCRQADIACSRAADRAFWQAMPVNVAMRWGGRMPNLTRIWCCHPAGDRAWCLDVVTALIEGHTEGRAAMVAEKRAEAKRRGEAADIPDGSLTTITFQTRSSPWHRQPRLARAPSLERVQAHEHIYTLGPLVGSSECLRVFDVPSTVDQKAEVLEQVPVAAEEGQPGPLANLEDIGPIEVSNVHMNNLVALNVWSTRLQVLGSVLVSRGCRRSLKSLKVKFIDATVVGNWVFQFAEALQTFASAVCIEGVSISIGSFHLDLLYRPFFPAAPSPVLKTLMSQLADQATVVRVDLRWSDLATPPTPAMLDMARGLAFNKATSAVVLGVDQPAQAAPATAPPALAIIEQIQPMPQVSELVLNKQTALAAGTQLANRMPNLQVLCVLGDVPVQQAFEAIKVIGCERELDMVAAMDIRGVGSGGIDIGEPREGFPQMTTLIVDLTVPAGVSDFVEFACSSTRSLLQLKCKALLLELRGLDASTRSLLESAVPAQLSSLEGTITLCSQQDDKLSIRSLRYSG
ncbi:unnamed protein product [Vitrella brassicaformis CCMP3155]|uniref:Uncharacterized protein n=1 Tax=Vitrella brassicaformis (strain CCMP3155) TaxID=1169540 RepID=A0A0G4H1K0_VITBC|nr:unnamed protein product [Vitrella brassicaformis CCMP3155]|eukprot:CEM37480.1 unnamed protein product [Vitrella brassicaformis CCMP3155]